MNVPGLKELIGNYMILFLFAIAVLYFICSIAARMQNKTKRRTRKQITHKYTKIDLCDYLTSNMAQEYIGQKKVLINELIKM